MTKPDKSDEQLVERLEKHRAKTDEFGYATGSPIITEALEHIKSLRADLAHQQQQTLHWVERESSANTGRIKAERELAEYSKQYDLNFNVAQHQLAEARAEIERKDEALEAINKLHFPRSATMSDEEIVANLRSMAFEALAAPAPEPNTGAPAEPYPNPSIWPNGPPHTPTTEREAERRVVDAAMAMNVRNSGTSELKFAEARDALFDACSALAAQQQATDAPK